MGCHEVGPPESEASAFPAASFLVRKVRDLRASPLVRVSRKLVDMSLAVVDVERLREVCERYGVARLEVFGSAARGTPRADSDIDLLYTLAPGVRLGWAIEDLASELSTVLRRPVDLVSRRALHPLMQDRVLREARLLYAA